MALEANLLASTDIVVRAFDEPRVERQIGLLWRRKSPRQAEFRLLGDFIAATQGR
jgi:LysR family hydrogen peroxide-inducible transcriptional activator